MEKKQIVFIEYIRVVACFLVMLVHASENFYGADSSGLAGNVSMLANESNRFWVSFYDGALSRICVPLFMVVSAFLLFTCIEQKEAPRWITGISRLSFSMYLMHLFFLATIAGFFVNGNQAEPLIPVWAAIPLHSSAFLSVLCDYRQAAVIFTWTQVFGHIKQTGVQN